MSQTTISKLETDSVVTPPVAIDKPSQHQDVRTHSIDLMMIQLVVQSMNKEISQVSLFCALRQVEDAMNADLTDFLNNLKDVEDYVDRYMKPQGNTINWTDIRDDVLNNHVVAYNTWISNFRSQFNDLFNTPREIKYTDADGQTQTIKGKNWLEVYAKLQLTIDGKNPNDPATLADFEKHDSLFVNLNSVQDDLSQFHDPDEKGNPSIVDWFEGKTDDNVSGTIPLEALSMAAADYYNYNHDSTENQHKYDNTLGKCVTSISSKSELVSSQGGAIDAQVNCDNTMITQSDNIGQNITQTCGQMRKTFADNMLIH